MTTFSHDDNELSLSVSQDGSYLESPLRIFREAAVSSEISIRTVESVPLESYNGGVGEGDRDRESEAAVTVARVVYENVVRIDPHIDTKV